jgi:hypothetical protein
MLFDCKRTPPSRYHSTMRPAAAQELNYSSKALLDYTSPHGPRVTHVRGILLANAQNNLREFGILEHYLEALPEHARGPLKGVIASSWIDMEIAVLHYRTADAMAKKHGVSEASFRSVGDRLAARLAETFLGTSIRAARNAGLESFLFVMKQSDRMWNRVYMGGGCLIRQVGPKEIVREDRGNPLLSLPSFCIGYNAYMKAMSSLFCKTVFVRPALASEPGPDRLATRFSWV